MFLLIVAVFPDLHCQHKAIELSAAAALSRQNDSRSPVATVALLKVVINSSQID